MVKFDYENAPDVDCASYIKALTQELNAMARRAWNLGVEVEITVEKFGAQILDTRAGLTQVRVSTEKANEPIGREPGGVLG